MSYSIYYNSEAFSRQTEGGITRCFSELIPRIHQIEGFRAVLDAGLHGNSYLPQEAEWLGCSKVWRSGDHFRGRGRIQTILNNIRFYHRKKNDFDLCHLTGYHTDIPGGVRGIPLVVTVFDMIHELFPEFFPKNDPTAAEKSKLLQRVDGIAVISETTRRDLLSRYPLDPARIAVTPLASSLQATERRELLLPERYLLYVGRRDRYKNFQLLYRAVRPLLYRDSRLHLVCGGGGRWSKIESEQLKDDRLNGQVRLIIRPDDRMLEELYSRAQLLVVPSLYEGFGLPVVEAFNCGCAVITSDGGSLPEVGGNATRRFAADSESELRELLEEILRSPDLLIQLRRAAAAAAERFSWKKTAEHTAGLYRQVLEKRGCTDV